MLPESVVPVCDIPVSLASGRKDPEFEVPEFVSHVFVSPVLDDPEPSKILPEREFPEPLSVPVPVSDHESTIGSGSLAHELVDPASAVPVPFSGVVLPVSDISPFGSVLPVSMIGVGSIEPVASVTTPVPLSSA
jgi:hypothetical protein